MAKFTEYLKEQRSIENDEMNNPSEAYSEINTEILTLLRQIRDNQADVQNLLEYDKDQLVSFISMSLDYGLYNSILKQ